MKTESERKKKYEQRSRLARTCEMELELELEQTQTHSKQNRCCGLGGQELLCAQQVFSPVSLCSETNKQGTAESLSGQNSEHNRYSRTVCGLVVISS
jgi:hypothetical protein